LFFNNLAALRIFGKISKPIIAPSRAYRTLKALPTAELRRLHHADRDND
jgi:hypothetical protein